jgi:hypothetical protein
MADLPDVKSPFSYSRLLVESALKHTLGIVRTSFGTLTLTDGHGIVLILDLFVMMT